MRQKKDQSEFYVSLVIETEGPIPGVHSMRALGAVAIDTQGEAVGEFECYLERLKGAQIHPDAQSYWSMDRNKTMLDRIEQESRAPRKAMEEMVQWLKQLKGKPVLASYNSAYTWLWTSWYTSQFNHKNPFAMTPIDIRSLMSLLVGNDFLTFSKLDLPTSWRLNTGRSDSVSDKAKKQAHLLESLIKARKDLHDYLSIPKWLRSHYGPPVRDAIRQARKDEAVGSA